MGKVLLSRQRSLFEFHQIVDGSSDRIVMFDCDGRIFTMTEVDWIDMGSPDVVTTSVEPGDLLNPDYMVDEITGDVT